MSANLCVVEHCGRPATEMLCSGCTAELVTALRELATGGKDMRAQRRPGLIEELATTAARQTATAANLGTRVDTSLRVFEEASAMRIVDGPRRQSLRHSRASDVTWIVDNTISTWARDFAEVHTHLTLAATTTRGAAEWLGRFPALLAMHPAAREMHDEITSLVDLVRHVIDRQPERVNMGRCSTEIDGQTCDADLYAVPQAKHVRCGVCGVEHDTADLREATRLRADNHIGTAAEISRLMLTLMGEELSDSAIRGMKSRGRIMAKVRDERTGSIRLRAKDDEGPDQFRVGDVLEARARLGRHAEKAEEAS